VIIIGGYFFLYFFLKTLLIHQADAKAVSEIQFRSIQAAERILLFLERSHPIQLKKRCPDSCKSATEAFQFVMLSLEEEFFHNVIQQLYLPMETWDVILHAKNQLQEIAQKSLQMVGPHGTPETFFEQFEKLCSQVDVDFREEARRELHHFVQQYSKR
jgi:hypothetical protein